MAQDIIGNQNGQSFFVGSDTPTTTPPVTRYTTPPVIQEAPLAAPNTPVSSVLNKPALGTIDENAIREQTRQRMQSSIDAINANYSNLISQEKVQGQDRSGQTRAVNARSGLMGSDFGTAQQEKTTQFNTNQEKALVDAQNAQVTAVMQNIEDRASQEIMSRKNEALQKYQMDMGEYEKAQASARADLKTLAEKGVDLNTLNPAQKAALLKQSGYDEGMGEVIYNAMKPKQKQIDYKFEKLADGTGMFYGTDPETGELKTQKVSIDLPPDWQVQIAPDGTVLGFNKNTGESKVLSAQGQFAKSEDFTLGEGQIRYDANGNPIAQGPPKSLKQNIVKVNGVDYVVDEQGNLTTPQVPQGQVSELKQSALSSAQALLDKFNKGQGTSAVGTSRLFGLQLIPGTSPKSFENDFNTLKSQLSLDNVKLLKGQGQVSDAERKLLGEASTRLNLSQSEGDFKSALEDIVKALSGTSNSGGQIIEYQGHQYQTDPQGNFDPNRPLTKAGSGATNAQAAITQNNTLASAVTKMFPAGSVGGQCGHFVSTITKALGLSYPPVGDSLASKINTVQKYGTSVSNARIGSVIVTKENPTYGHVAYIIGKNAEGWIVAESNYKQSNQVSYGRVIPFNSSKVVGVINPTSKMT
jgi:hypothetical protein